MKKIRIHFAGWDEKWLLGTLADNGRDLLFEYSPQALTRGIEFSPRHLKLRSQAYGQFPSHQFKLPGLIVDSLPDGWGLLLMDRYFRKYLGRQASDISALDRLAFIGDRAMGALIFEPATDLVLPEANFKLPELAREVKAVVADHDTDALRQLVLLGGSPQGARPKALIQHEVTSRLVSTLETAPGTPWLVKFPARGEHKEVCAIENLYAELARQCQLDMPRTRYFELGASLAAFAIERFDRHEGRRVPMHTLAGALNANFQLPDTSYQTLLRMTRLMTKSEVEVRKAFERCVFNVAFNNRDDHTRNFSFRMDESFNWKLAPCYDLAYCVGPGGEHQMDIEGEGRNPERSHLLKLASLNSLDDAWANDVIERMTSVAAQFKTISGEHAIRPATRNEIAKAIAANCKRLSQWSSA